MTKLLLAHPRDILTYVYRDKLMYRIPIYFKEEHLILQKASYIELTIPQNYQDMNCKIVNLHTESVLPVKTTPEKSELK